MKIVLSMLFAVAACGGSKPAPAPAPSAPAPSAKNDCIKTGCSGTLCAEPGNDTITTCEMRPEYACYGSATCARQSDGKCGWTQTPELTSCLAKPPGA